MATELVEKILAASLPGLELVELDSAQTGADQQLVAPKPGPSLAQLRAKYLGYAADASANPAQSPATAPERVEVRQARSRAGNPGSIGNRTLIFSEKGLIGSQG